MAAERYKPGGACRRGHALTGDNLRRSEDRWRCRKCIAIAIAKRRANWGRWEAKNPEKAKRCNKNTKLQITYGITADQFDTILMQQGGMCPICMQAFGGHARGPLHPVVDHCHDGGGVRGILCNNCNRGMGLLGDDPVLLRAAASYLEVRGSPRPQHKGP